MIPPSSLARLVLGYLEEEGLHNTVESFQTECIQIVEDPFSNLTSLKLILEEYLELKDLVNSTKPDDDSVMPSLWKKMDAVIGQLKYHTLPTAKAPRVQRHRAAKRTPYEKLQSEKVKCTVLPKSPSNDVCNTRQLKERNNLTNTRNKKSQLGKDSDRPIVILNPDKEQTSIWGKDSQVSHITYPHNDAMPSLETPNSNLTSLGNVGERSAHSVLDCAKSNQDHLLGMTTLDESPHKNFAIHEDLASNQMEILSKSPKRKGHPPKKRNVANSSPAKIIPIDPNPEESHASDLKQMFDLQQLLDGCNVADDAMPFLLETFLNTPLLQEKLAENINKVVTCSSSKPTQPVSESISEPIEESTVITCGKSGDHQDEPQVPVDDILSLMEADPVFESLFSLLATDGGKIPSPNKEPAASIGSSSLCGSVSAVNDVTCTPTCTPSEHILATAVVAESLLALATSPTKFPMSEMGASTFGSATCATITPKALTPEAIGSHLDNQRFTGGAAPQHTSPVSEKHTLHVRSLQFFDKETPKEPKKTKKAKCAKPLKRTVKNTSSQNITPQRTKKVNSTTRKGTAALPMKRRKLSSKSDDFSPGKVAIMHGLPGIPCDTSSTVADQTAVKLLQSLALSHSDVFSKSNLDEVGTGNVNMNPVKMCQGNSMLQLLQDAAIHHQIQDTNENQFTAVLKPQPPQSVAQILPDGRPSTTGHLPGFNSTFMQPEPGNGLLERSPQINQVLSMPNFGLAHKRLSEINSSQQSEENMHLLEVPSGNLQNGGLLPVCLPDVYSSCGPALTSFAPVQATTNCSEFVSTSSSIESLPNTQLAPSFLSPSSSFVQSCNLQMPFYMPPQQPSFNQHQSPTQHPPPTQQPSFTQQSPFTHQPSQSHSHKSSPQAQGTVVIDSAVCSTKNMPRKHERQISEEIIANNSNQPLTPSQNIEKCLGFIPDFEENFDVTRRHSTHKESTTSSLHPSSVVTMYNKSVTMATLLCGESNTQKQTKSRRSEKSQVSSQHSSDRKSRVDGMKESVPPRKGKKRPATPELKENQQKKTKGSLKFKKSKTKKLPANFDVDKFLSRLHYIEK